MTTSEATRTGYLFARVGNTHRSRNGGRVLHIVRDDDHRVCYCGTATVGGTTPSPEEVAFGERVGRVCGRCAQQRATWKKRRVPGRPPAGG
jgi:hypothetical protein